MSSDIRVISIAAGVAFVLSALVGVFSHVAVGALLLRALGSGIAFAALTAGASFVARRFLPDLFESQGSTEAPSQSTEEPEHRLNIVLPGDGDEEGKKEAQSPSMESMNVGEAELRDFEREAEEIGTDTLVPEEESPRIQPGPAAARPPASFEDLDVLPDLDSFSDVFSIASHGDIDAGESPPRDPISTTGASRDGVDPVAMAQAVRTLLKRDQKG